MLDETTAEALIRQGEHQQLEFKATAPDGAILERIVLGMANTEGGTILIGVGDDGLVSGLEPKAVARSQMDVTAVRNEYPDLLLSGAEVVVGGKIVLAVTVEPVANPEEQIADRSGRTWRRIGASTRQAWVPERRVFSGTATDVDIQTYRSSQRLPFGALRSALQQIQSRCAYPQCGVTDPLEVAAIASLEPGGPRYEPSQSDQQRASLTNLMLMCPNHHVIVDRDPTTYNLKWMTRARQAWTGALVAEHSGSPTPSCFLSYAWESHSHIEWVARLASDLQSEFGVAVLLDAWVLRPGDSVTQFMENAVEDADFVAMVLTPSYAARVKNREGGVGYEGGIVTGQMLEGRNPRRSLPLLRGDPTICVPAFLRGHIYVDFRDEKEYAHRIEELARAIHGAPKAVPPPMGRPPWKR